MAALLKVAPATPDQVALYFDGKPLIVTHPDGLRIMANRYSRALANSMRSTLEHVAADTYKRVIYPIAWQGPTLEDVVSELTETPNPAKPLRIAG
jgi:hypothetical protein